MTYATLIEERYAEAVKGIKEEWFNTQSTKWYEYIIGLSDDLKICYSTVVFHNQIFNGGFHQYFVNGYGQFAQITINSLRTIGAIKKATLLEKAIGIVNYNHYSDEVFRRKLLNNQIPKLFDGDDLFEPLDELDVIYYNSENEDIERLLGIYLSPKK
ncbi:DUF4375 domain-containing protein [Flavobacterium supellecticarium]|uniref:DUF4375 domain-containing protein n=1 Tax=Flavobacterium supellecticarium TaxID=2565924 RepID=A0A4S4A3Y2_9FLAO|nr:DUF4375 domain-containing protein [Flavobacterium supellecticarium]THF53147.1 DUF4375 domain-containing protein [Flavobacterium supellecticarium]